MGGADDTRLITEIQNYLAGGRLPPPAPDPIDRRRSRRLRRQRRGMRNWNLWRHRRFQIVAVVVLIGAIIALQQRSNASPGTDHASSASAGPGYSFMRVNRNGAPVRWNPCQPLHYRTNLTEAPIDAASDLSAAIVSVSQATGLRFVDDGATTTIPTTTYGVDSQGHAKPVVIAWATPSQTDGLGQTRGALGLFTTGELGRGGATALVDRVRGRSVYISGSVVIDANASRILTPGFGTNSLGLVLMHELGHLVGLGHTNDASAVMYPKITPTKTGAWSPGDQAGLSRLGAASGCLTVPHRRTLQIGT